MKLKLKLFIAFVTAIATLPSIITWGSGIKWQVSNIENLTVFPLLGLLAFGLMWSHYIVGIVRRRWPEAIDYSRWWSITSFGVLILFLAHPALLIYEGQTNDFNAVDYVGKAMIHLVYLAYFAISGFLLFEVYSHLRQTRFFTKYRPAVLAINNAAFVAIFFHGLFLGRHLQSGWMLVFWVFLGVTAAIAITDSYHYEITQSKDT